MRIDASSYELIARADGRRRAGALLRVEFDDGVRGFADLHPWPELGDEPLDDQLAALARLTPFPLAARSLALARADGEGRSEARSLFEGLNVPPSHASLPFGHTPDALARAVEEGYSLVKLKGWDFSADDLALFRDSGLRFRLDFNARLSYGQIVALLDRWGDLGWVAWLEDPCPYDSEAWSVLRSRVRLAIDFEKGEEAFDVRVVKPARDAPLPPRGRGFAFTSYLDHPIGQLGAAWTAALFAADYPVEMGGLVTHPVYEPNPFSERLRVEKTRLVPPGGPGLGFAHELEALEWTTLEP